MKKILTLAIITMAISCRSQQLTKMLVEDSESKLTIEKNAVIISEDSTEYGKVQKMFRWQELTVQQNTQIEKEKEGGRKPDFAGYEPLLGDDVVIYKIDVKPLNKIMSSPVDKDDKSQYWKIESVAPIDRYLAIEIPESYSVIYHPDPIGKKIRELGEGERIIEEICYIPDPAKDRILRLISKETHPVKVLIYFKSKPAKEEK